MVEYQARSRTNKILSLLLQPPNPSEILSYLSDSVLVQNMIISHLGDCNSLLMDPLEGQKKTATSLASLQAILQTPWGVTFLKCESWCAALLLKSL